MSDAPFKKSKTFDLAQFHFKSDRTVEDFIALTPISKSDLIVEIGPGSGRITKALAPLCAEVIAIELDSEDSNPLKEIAKKHANIKLIWMDFLQHTLPTTPYKIVANIPFNQTRNILQKIVTDKNNPTLICLILQTEVSEKICRAEREHSLLSAFIQNFYSLTTIKTFQRNDYQPMAHVDTVALLMEIKNELPKINKADFFQFIATTFENPGQPLKNRLKPYFTYNQLKKISADFKINLNSAPHTLTSQNWLNLFELHQKLNESLN